jgi:hypothetical protein
MSVTRKGLDYVNIVIVEITTVATFVRPVCALIPLTAKTVYYSTECIGAADCFDADSFLNSMNTCTY